MRKNRKATAVISRPAEKSAQATAMLTRRITGSSIKAIAEEFGCSRSKVHRMLTHAQQSGALEAAQTQSIQTLMPKALEVYADALDNGDVGVARDVLFGCGILRKGRAANDLGANDATADEDPYKKWREGRRKRVD